MKGSANMTEWPKGVAKPAVRALQAAGYTQLQQLENVDLSTLAHYMGWGRKRSPRLKRH